MIHNPNVQWDNLDGDRLLSDKPCWLHHAYVSASNDSAGFALYDGHDANGKKITDMWCDAAGGINFKPAKPVYCRQGLYVVVEALSFMFVEYELENYPHGEPLPILPEELAKVAGQV